MERTASQSDSPLPACADTHHAIDGEDYAILGGLVGGLFLMLLYILYLRLVDCYYRWNHTRHEVDDGAYSPGAHAQQMGRWSERHVRETRRVSMDATRDKAYFSPLTARRQGKFDTDVVEPAETPCGADHQDSSYGERRAAFVERERGNEGMQQFHPAGSLHDGGAFSPPPRW